MDTGERGVAGDTRLVVAVFTAGVLLVHALPSLPSPSVLLMLGPLALWPWRGRLLLAALLLGVLLSSWHAGRLLERQWPDARHNEELSVRGRIVSLPGSASLRSEEGESADTLWRFSFAPDDPALPERIRVSWYRGPARLRGGDCWQLQLRLRAPHGSLNPDGFDYEAWLYRQHLGATATVRSAEPCAEHSGWRVLRLRQAWLDRIDAVLGARPGAALLKALTIGATGDLRDADWDDFRLTGTTHLVAISGFNLALAAGLAWFVLRWSWALSARACTWLPAQTAALYGSAIFALCYALLAGLEAPVLRALLMLLAVTLALLLNRPAQASHLLAIAWLLIVAADPCAVLTPGLWLSFGAVAAIFYLSLGRLRPPAPWRAAISVQLMLSVALAPLGLYYFHGLSLSAVLINLLAVPLFALLTPLLLVLSLLAVVSQPLALLVLPPLATLLELVLQLLHLAAQASAQAWWAAAPAPAALLLALIGAALLFAPRGLPLWPLGMLCWLPLLIPAPPPARGGLEVTALDVGQGLAVLVRTPHHTLLFDTGPAHPDGFDAGASVVAPYVLGLGLRQLDLLLVSHGDNDHAGGVPAVRRLLRVRREIGTDSGEPCRDGQRWEWDGVRFAVLHPQPRAELRADQQSQSRNDQSCVLKIDGPFSVLLPGDIEKRGEARLLDTHAAELRADLLLAPHHGSRSSSTEEFVAAVHPQWLIFPAGWRNRFRHPRPEVVRRYGRCGIHAQLLMTGERGAITLFRDAAGVLQAEAWRDQHHHFWNAPLSDTPYWRQDADEASRAAD